MSTTNGNRSQKTSNVSRPSQSPKSSSATEQRNSRSCPSCKRGSCERRIKDGLQCVDGGARVAFTNFARSDSGNSRLGFCATPSHCAALTIDGLSVCPRRAVMGSLYGYTI